MNFDAVRAIADAVLYEGYILYPYRPTSAKNRQRWTFGGVYPAQWQRASGGADPCFLQSQCLIEGGDAALLEVRLRFLQPVARELGALAQPLPAGAEPAWSEDAPPAFEPVSTLEIGGQRLHQWQEATEHEIRLPPARLAEIAAEGLCTDFAFEADRDFAALVDPADGSAKGVLIHRRVALCGQLRVDAARLDDSLWQLTLRTDNRSTMPPRAEIPNREEASLYSFASSHLLLGIEEGAFVSLIDPPESLTEAARACQQEGAWPVLAGPPGSRDRLLCSPIILYDHPEVAPESPGDLFDGTEIDEILSLNILAMTDTEKQEMAAADPRAARLLERTEQLGPDDFMRLHGVLRKPHPEDLSPAVGDPANPVAEAMQTDPDAGPRPAELTEADEPWQEATGPQLAVVYYRGQRLKVGDRVRLHPKGGGDVMDLVLDGRTAVIESIERDFEDRLHIAVAIDDDPGREWGLQRMPGHRFFYSPEEIEPLPGDAAPPPGRPHDQSQQTNPAP